jgi:hypothetical protein
MLGMLMLTAAYSCGQPYRMEPSARPIATPAPYPAGLADSVRRDGFNGKLYITRPVMGGYDAPPNPEADQYGAYMDQPQCVRARVGHLVVPIDPYTPWTKQGHRDLEAARNFYLQEQGYTGGVRTFVNDAVVFRAMERAAEQPAEPHADASGKADGLPQPRATFRLAPDAPRQRSRLRVMHEAGSRPAVAAKQVDRR